MKKLVIKVSATVVLLAGLVAFAAVPKHQADPGDGKPGDEPTSYKVEL